METIASALIGAVVAIVTCLINNNTQRAKEQHAIEMQIQEIKASNQQTVAIIEERIQNLTDHVNKHNNLVERMYDVEGRTKELALEIEVLKHD